MLIDGHSILNRAFFGVPDLTNSEGIHTNAMYGFLNIMFKFLDEEKPDYLVVAFDLSKPTFRHEKYSEYKAGRHAMAPELKEQVPLMKEILESMNIKIVSKEGFEADDLIGTFAKKNAARGLDVTVISGDRDLLQLVEDHIKVRIPKTKHGSTEVEDYLPADVFEAYGVTPLEFIELKALMGDSSDNIKGAAGVGPKTASALISKYKSVAACYEHIDELKPPKAKKALVECREDVELARFLVEIDIDVPIDSSLDQARIDNMFNLNSYDLIKKYNFKSMFKRFDGEQIEDKKIDLMDKITLVEDFAKFEEVIAKVKKQACEQKVAFAHICDCNPSADYEDRYKLVLTAFALSSDEIYLIPPMGLINEAYIKSKMDDLNEDQAAHFTTINLKDQLFMFSHSLKAHIDDLALMSYLEDPLISEYSADIIASKWMETSLSSKEELLGKKTFAQVLLDEPDKLYQYAAQLVYVAYAAHDLLKDKLNEDDMYNLYENIELPLVSVLFNMEKRGITVDLDSLKSYSSVLIEKINSLHDEIIAQVGEDFNINSPKQLGLILFEKLGLPSGKKTKTGYSTSADILEKLAVDYPIVSKILDYRQLTKLNSTFAEGLQNYISKDGRIHSTFNQLITATGRISSKDPNLQNIPIRYEIGRQLRKVFIPKEGSIFIDADYSQIELRILAAMSSDKNLIDAYNSDEDIHRITASQVFGKPLDEVDSDLRRKAKAVNFGIVYGISSFGLGQGLNISKKEASEYIDKYFETYPGVKAYLDDLIESAKNKGYSLTYFKRRRPIPELKSSNFMQRSFGERVAMNAPIQGTAADIIKIAMIETEKETCCCWT